MGAGVRAIWQLLPLVLAAFAAAAQDSVRRVHLRDGARLVETIAADSATLRCERNGGDEIPQARWIRDCNALARELLRRHARDGRLRGVDIGREPLGEPDAGGELSLVVPLGQDDARP